MSPKHHHAPLSGGDRKALKKELSKSRAMTHDLRRAVGGKAPRGRGADPGSRQPRLSKLERTHVERRRPHRSEPDHRSSHQRRLTHGWRSSARDARRRAMSIYAHCATCRRHACTISPGGWFVRSARRPGSVRLRRCSSLPRARASRRRRRTKRKTEIRQWFAQETQLLVTASVQRMTKPTATTAA